MKKIGSFILTIVALSAATVFAEEVDSSPFPAEGYATTTQRSCWGALYPCDDAESQMNRFARNTCGPRLTAIQVSPTESFVDLAFARPGCVFSCTTRAQFRCVP